MSDEVVTQVDPMVALLAAVKTYLQITWTDVDTDNRLKELIRAGIYYIKGKVMDDEDYSVASYPRTLLFEYVRYARDGALDVFENNYRALILALQHERMVDLYVQSAQGTV